MCIRWQRMLQVILLTTVSISTLLNVSKEDKRLWFGHSPGLFFLLFSTSSSTLGRSFLIVVSSVCNSDAKMPFTWVQLYRVQLIKLLWNLAMCVIVVIKAISDTYLCWLCILRWQVRAPPVVAAVCLGTSLSLEIPVLHRGGKRQERAEMVQVVCICTCSNVFFFSFCLYIDTEEVEPENSRASL